MEEIGRYDFSHHQLGQSKITSILNWLLFQECHEKIRVLSFEVKKEIVETGCRNNLIEKLEKDPYFANIVPELSTILDPKTFTGCASAQVPT